MKMEEKQIEMAKEEEAKIPQFDFSSESLEQGSEKWKELSNKVRGACEEYGCFFLTYNEKIPQTLREDTFKAMESFFDLPKKTKMKHQSPDPYGGYMNGFPGAFTRESLGINDAASMDAAQAFVLLIMGLPCILTRKEVPLPVCLTAFTSLMWPEGNPSFCNVLQSMSSNMLELNFTVLKMIFDSYGVTKYYDADIENTCSSFRPMKYHMPPPGELDMGLVPHMDSNTMTILCQNGVQGLEILSKLGHWSKVIIPEGNFLVVVGEMLKVWSNGKLHTVEHKVTMSEKKERYSCGLFTMPKDGVIIEAPREFIEEECSRRRYRPFTYTDYVSYNISILKANSLEAFASVSS